MPIVPSLWRSRRNRLTFKWTLEFLKGMMETSLLKMVKLSLTRKSGGQQRREVSKYKWASVSCMWESKLTHIISQDPPNQKRVRENFERKKTPKTTKEVRHSHFDWGGGCLTTQWGHPISRKWHVITCFALAPPLPSEVPPLRQQPGGC